MDFLNATITVLGGSENYVQSLSVIVTTFMAIFAFMNIWFSRKDKRDATRANVICYFRTKGIILQFVIKNTGLTEAINVKIVSDIDIDSHRKESLNSFFNKNIGSMAPNFRMVFYIGPINFYREKFTENHYLTMRFDDIYGKTHDKNFALNLNDLENGISIGDSYDTIDVSLREISDNTKELKKQSKEIVREIKGLK